MKRYRIESWGLSDIGLTRPNNEDVFRVLPEKKFYILADGMGGHNAGEVASSLAVNSCCSFIQPLSEDASIEETCQLLRETIAHANREVFTLSQSSKDYSGMGTTLCCFALREDVLVYAHVGDSRLYRKRHKVEQLTADHSLRHIMLANAEQNNGSPPSLLYRNVITRAIGTHSYVLPDVGVIPLRLGDVYMLCSDGLSDLVPEKMLFELLDAPAGLEEIAQQLVRSALEKGGNDNITLLLVKISE